jgi:aerobic-type carbon monoxide dehydrogenase small subunit (CoxS/CutS family)
MTQVSNMKDLVAYQDGSIVSKEIIKKPTGTVTIFAFDQEQGLSEHTAPFDALVYVLDGEADIAIAGKLHHPKEITTIEGLAKEGKLHSLQQNFVDHGAIQCGFCTPGMILSAKAMLDENPKPTEEEVKRGISGNLCRCTGYTKIIEAITATVK